MDRFAHYGWPFFEERHRELARKADAWARSGLDFSLENNPDNFCKKTARALGAAHFLEHCVAERPDVRSISLLREVFAYHAGLADFAFVMQGLGSGPLVLAGTEEQKKLWLPRVARGEAIAAFALSEPEAGSDVAALSSVAKKTGKGWEIDGTKTWISNGGIADFYVVFAKAPEGITAFLVRASEVDASERIDIIAPHPMATLKLKKAKAELIGEPGQGFKLAMRNLDIFRTTVAGAALGFARRALDEALARAKDRPLFGQKLADLQMTQARLADMGTGIEASALLTYRSAWTKDVKQTRVTKEAAMAKLHATETAQQVVDAAVQIFGGLGVKSGHPVERLYREVRALRIYEGATEVQKVIIARELLK
ncbi:MAG TPA: acyl-CoA dehydrogenase family protein [Burkholderiales bacterium]|nr:acyl-CoA dehydrogenase family protein [Burkholderiales bacterium]